MSSLNSILLNLQSYSDLSPDWQLRQLVNQRLQSRPLLAVLPWHHTWWQQRQMPLALSRFVYQRLSHYAGLEMGRVQPQDHLEHDLHLTMICWFDWQLQLCEDFWQDFGIDLQDALLTAPLATIADLMSALHTQFSVRSS